MTKWRPDIAGADVEHYRAIVDALVRDIGAGLLKPGEKLPPHRELAGHLGLAVGTVTKAYSEAKRRGFVRSNVGSGTYVCEHPLRERRRLMTDREDSARVDLSFSGPILAGLHEEALRAGLEEQARSETLFSLLPYHRPWIGHEHHREAAAAWMARFGLSMDAADIAIVSGAQHAASVALLTTARAGEIVVTEDLVDPSTRLLIGGLGLNLRGVRCDRDGIIPSAFEEVCRSEKVRAMVCMPDHHSPTLAVWPIERRREIVEIARRYEVTILENAVYRPFLDNAPQPLAGIAPELTYYYTSVSKIMAPGLRVGFLAAPAGRADDLVLGIGATNWMTPPLAVDIVARWIETGKADELLKWQREELTRRNDIAREVLGPYTRTLPSGLHVWLELPERWRAAAFERAARAAGILVSPSDVFATGTISAPPAVRISLGGGARSENILSDSLGAIRELLGRKVGSLLDF